MKTAKQKLAETRRNNPMPSFSMPKTQTARQRLTSHTTRKKSKGYDPLDDYL